MIILSSYGRKPYGERTKSGRGRAGGETPHRPRDIPTRLPAASATPVRPDSAHAAHILSRLPRQLIPPPLHATRKRGGAAYEVDLRSMPTGKGCRVIIRARQHQRKRVDDEQGAPDPTRRVLSNQLARVTDFSPTSRQTDVAYQVPCGP